MIRSILRGLLVAVCIAAALWTYAVMNRYEVSIGGSSRYYSVIRLDRWTGSAWKLDNSGEFWFEIEPPQDYAPKD
jgi:hypothetical protein